MKIIFLTRQLDYGGAERQLAELAKGLHRKGIEVGIAVLHKSKRNFSFEGDLLSAGIAIYNLHERRRHDFPGFLYTLIMLLRREAPDILHGYGDGANVLASLIKSFIPSVRIIWGVRSSKLLLGNSWKSRLIYRTEAALSGWNDLIIANSESGYEYAISRGFPDKRMTVISNGINTEEFRPDPDARRIVREEWGYEKNSKLVGIVGHIRPIKDLPTFLRAMALLVKLRSDLNFICVGDGNDEYKKSLHELASKLDLGRQLRWIEPRQDMCAVYNSLDLLCSSSLSEGFSNVISEAMACGVSCVVTEVGDSARIVGDTGIAVPPMDPVALAKGCEQMLLRIEKDDIASMARSRIIEVYSISRMVDNTFEKLCNMDG